MLCCLFYLSELLKLYNSKGMLAGIKSSRKTCFYMDLLCDCYDQEAHFNQSPLLLFAVLLMIALASGSVFKGWSWFGFGATHLP
jgi:hypothetical protein